MDDELRALVTKPFDLGSFDKDIGWCGDWHTLTTEDGVHFHLLREGDENGVRKWTSRCELVTETLDREAGVLVLRGETYEIVFDLRAGVAVHGAYTPTGSVPLGMAPSETSLEPWLCGVSGLFWRLGLAQGGPRRIAWSDGGEPRRARLFVGEEPVADARIVGAPAREIAIDGLPGKRLLLRWSAQSPGELHVVGEVLPRSAFLPLRRALIAGIGWTPRRALVCRLTREAASDVIAAPEAVEVTTLAARGETLAAVRDLAGAIARRAHDAVESASLAPALAGLASDRPEPHAAAILDRLEPETLDALGFRADLEAMLALEGALEESDLPRHAPDRLLASRLRATLVASAPAEVPADVLEALRAPRTPESVARLQAWQP